MDVLSELAAQAQELDMGVLMKYTVIFDACVLYPAPLRDFPLRLSIIGQFSAKWTDEIHDEWIRNFSRAALN